MASPAKLNLFLAVTGRRADGYHELVSLVSTVAWGDTVELALDDGPDEIVLSCTSAGVPAGPANLAWRAAALYREERPFSGRLRIGLEKRIPAGAGLGGGSSNAAAVLWGLERLLGDTPGEEVRRARAARLGSDVPLFLAPGPVLMRGRGEKTETVPPKLAAALKGRPVLIFKPGVEIATARAYQALAAGAPESHTPESAAEDLWRRWVAAPGSAPLANSFSAVAAAKFPAIALLLERLRKTFGARCQLSGSGSACFWLDPPAPPGPEAAIREAWGPEAFLVRTHLGHPRPNLGGSCDAQTVA
ncbi:MAG: 4-(cytidine 5'-diphospho)-2-C-methyl-D-erythritol kinase [Puniceicoccaceae bacterium]|nr:MAG: 4-(cytidine 5'-diphospho)-2-C-methyl-D-erythritol kinase [Puniceicoccaceae bacterium]